MGRFAKHRSNLYSKKEGGTIILAVVLLLLPAPCPGDAVFRCEVKVLCLGFQKRTQPEIVVKNCRQPPECVQRIFQSTTS